jgi:hypothetical protein
LTPVGDGEREPLHAPRMYESQVLDLHGILTIGLVGATPEELAGVRRQLGPLRELRGVAACDLTVRFVDPADAPAGLRFVGRDAGASDDSFVVLRGRRQTDVRVRVPVEQIGDLPIEIVVERGPRMIPYLLPIVLLSALARGWIPVHASAFVADGRGVLVTGWAKGGKTETLLAFADRGAAYVGDEWVLVSPDGTKMAGVQESMRVWDWQLAMVPGIRRRIGLDRRFRLGSAAIGARSLASAARLPVVGASGAGDAARRIGAILERQRAIQLAPGRIFGGGVLGGPRPLDHVLLVGTSTRPGVRVEAIDPTVLADRTAATVVHELLDVVALDLAHRVVFPERRNPVLEDLEGILRTSLRAAFAGRPCHEVTQAYPPEIPALYAPIAKVLA